MSSSVRVAIWRAELGGLQAVQNTINQFIEMKVMKVVSLTQSQSTKPHAETCVVFTMLYRPNLKKD